MFWTFKATKGSRSSEKERERDRNKREKKKELVWNLANSLTLSNKLNCVFVLEWQTPEDLDLKIKLQNYRQGHCLNNRKWTILLRQMSLSCFILESIHFLHNLSSYSFTISNPFQESRTCELIVNLFSDNHTLPSSGWRRKWARNSSPKMTILTTQFFYMEQTMRQEFSTLFP